MENPRCLTWSLGWCRAPSSPHRSRRRRYSAWSRNGGRRCSAKARLRSAPRAAHPRRRRRARAARAGRSKSARARMPRSTRQVEVVPDVILRLPRRRPNARAAGHRRHVPRYRGLRAANPRVLSERRADGDELDDGMPAGATRIDLHVRLTDRSLCQTNPVLGVVAQLLDLAGGRLTASLVLDLAERAPVRRRVRLTTAPDADRPSGSATVGCGSPLDTTQRAEPCGHNRAGQCASRALTSFVRAVTSGPVGTADTAGTLASRERGISAGLEASDFVLGIGSVTRGVT